MTELEEAREILRDLGIVLIGAAGTMGRAVDQGVPDAERMRSILRAQVAVIHEHMDRWK